MATRVLFMGTPEFAVPSLEALADSNYHVVGVVTQPDRPSGRGRKLVSSPVKRFAVEHGLAVLQPPSLRADEAVAAMSALAPDVFIVAAYGLILPQAVLDVPKQGSLNVHGSLLPRYRGAAPITAAILAGAETTGITIILMDAGMDTGPMLSQAPCPMRPQDTMGDLTARLAVAGAALLMETLPRWLAGEIEPQPQIATLATYAPMVRKQDGRIVWARSASWIARQVRAYQPWPGATTHWNDRPLKILEAQPVPVPVGDEEPGRVLTWRGGTAVVTGDGLLRLTRVQLAGKRALPMCEFLHGHQQFLGSLLGDSSP
ncbi:MAG TPA: methionyl-tRNA formyltransferase [Anaerolineae bacterium]|nr:methionyl-tRNA formyltransferase [Anaerolineae bacterium]